MDYFTQNLIRKVCSWQLSILSCTSR